MLFEHFALRVPHPRIMIHLTLVHRQVLLLLLGHEADRLTKTIDRVQSCPVVVIATGVP